MKLEKCVECGVNDVKVTPEIEAINALIKRHNPDIDIGFVCPSCEEKLVVGGAHVEKFALDSNGLQH